MEKDEGIVKALINDEYFHKLIIDPDQKCIEFWKQWEVEHPNRKISIEKAKRILLAPKFKPHTLSKDRKRLIWTNISNKVEKESYSNSIRRRELLNRIVYGIAASISLILFFYYAFNNLVDQPSERELNEVKSFEKQAPKGKISSLKLDDGTVIKLFSGSRLVYPEKFEIDKREVYVEGEAFFEVAKDETRPFIVKTKSLITTTIGTSFNVYSYPLSNDCYISLVTGKVKVEKVNKSVETLNEIMLEPGEEALLIQNDVAKQHFNIEEKVAWKDGYIYLNDKSFDESLEILGRWFHADFIVKNKPATNEKRGTGKFKNQNLKNILEVMAYSYDFKFELVDNQVYINF